MAINEYSTVGFSCKRWKDVYIYGRAYTLKLMASDARNKAARKMREILYVERVAERTTEDLQEDRKWNDGSEQEASHY